MAVGLWRGTKLVKGGEGGGRPMLAVLVWVGLGYFIAHSLHDRVQALPELRPYLDSPRRLAFSDGIFRHYKALDA